MSENERESVAIVALECAIRVVREAEARAAEAKPAAPAPAEATPSLDDLLNRMSITELAIIWKRLGVCPGIIETSRTLQNIVHCHGGMEWGARIFNQVIGAEL